MEVVIQTNHNFKIGRAIFTISFYLIALIILLILPSDFFDNGKTICLSVYFFDIKCLGCGITRAIQHLIHGEIEIAASFNKLSFRVLPVLIIVIIQDLIKQFKLYKKLKRSKVLPQ